MGSANHGELNITPYVIEAMNAIPEMDKVLDPINWAISAFGGEPVTRADLTADKTIVQATNAVSDAWALDTIANLFEIGFSYNIGWNVDVLTQMRVVEKAYGGLDGFQVNPRLSSNILLNIRWQL